MDKFTRMNVTIKEIITAPFGTVMNNKKIFILFIFVLLLLQFFPFFFIMAESKNYQHLEGIIKDYYAKDGANVEIEPHGSRAADVLGRNNDGNKIIGEIKKGVEIERDLGGYWSQWNSVQQFGGKTSDYKLSDQYTDKGATLSSKARGWAAVIDGQLRGYCTKELFGRGDLVVENFTQYEKDILETLDYLKKQRRIISFEIERMPNSNIGLIRITFDKLPTIVAMPKPKESISNKSIYKASIDKKVTIDTDLSKPAIKVVQNPSIYSKIISKVVKASIVVSIFTAGYTVTKEVYNQKMAGKQVHPSRIFARIIVGIVGGLAVGFLLGSILGILFSWCPPVRVIAGIIGAIAGSVLGSIGAEWLFEIIMPYRGTGWAILDFLLGGVLGAIMGTFIGFVLGWWNAGRGNDEGFLKAIFTLLIIAPMHAIGGAIGGFFFGGFVGSLLFWLIFNVA